MQQPVCGLNGLNNDLMFDIMGQLDGSAMASASCTCSTLLHVARDQRLWQRLCRSTWPSTALEEAQHLFSNSFFDRFYANSYPLIVYNKPVNDDNSSKPLKCPTSTTCDCLSDFASLLDIYYKNECVLSKVFDGIPEVVKVCQANKKGCNCDHETNPDNHLYEYDEDNCHCDIDDDERLDLPISLLDYGKIQDNHSKELAKHLRLSWVLLEKKKRKAVNLSSWKPLSIRRSWPYNGNYVIQFGCILPVEETVLPHKLAKCIISATCKLMQKAGHLRWKEISIHIEDITGKHIGIQQSLIVMSEALYSPRSKNQLKVMKGHWLYEKKKQEMMKKKAYQDKLADWLCMSIQITVLVICLYSFVLPY